MAAAGQALEGGCGDAGRRGSQTQARLAAAALPAADVGAGDAEDAGDAVVVGIETCIMQGVVTERISKVEEEVRYSCARFRKDARLGADLICNYFSLSGLEVNTFFFYCTERNLDFTTWEDAFFLSTDACREFLLAKNYIQINTSSLLAINDRPY